MNHKVVAKHWGIPRSQIIILISLIFFHSNSCYSQEFQAATLPEADDLDEARIVSVVSTHPILLMLDLHLQELAEDLQSSHETPVNSVR